MKKRRLRLWRTAVMMAASVLCIITPAFGEARALSIRCRQGNVKGRWSDKDAAVAENIFLLDGDEISVTGYFIDNSDYFKLRDIAKMLNFAVEWDGANNSIMIDTSKPYTK